MRILPFAVLALAAGCDFDAQLKACAEAERCLIPNASKPTLRFPHNGAGLGSASAVTQLAWSPTRPYLAWDFEGDNTWLFRIQVHQCDHGQALADCPFSTEVSDADEPDIPGTTYSLEHDLQIGSRYWWRVRGCHTSEPGTPCGPWSDARYFDVGRPESIPNDFEGTGRGQLVVAGQHPANGVMPEPLYLFRDRNDGQGIQFWKELDVGPPPGLTSSPAYGTVISGAGDLNGDGYTDFAVAYRPSFGTGLDEAVPLQVFLSSSSGPGSATPITLGPQTDGFGLPLGRAGDVNGDGYSDLAVCQATLKQVVVYYGGSSGPSNAVAMQATLPVPNADLSKANCAFAALLDVDADGYDDIVVSGTGQVSVFRGREAFGPWTSSVDIPSPVGATTFGSSMAGGDFNGDGHGDLVVAGGNGKAYLYLGGPQWFSGQFPLPIAFDIGAGTVAPAGDVNNDGLADLVTGGGSTGQVRIYLGQATGAPKSVAVLSNGARPNFGVSFAGAGDLTGDSYDDVAVGSTGGVEIYRGSPSEAEVGTLPISVSPANGSVQFGIGLAPAY